MNRFNNTCWAATQTNGAYGSSWGPSLPLLLASRYAAFCGTTLKTQLEILSILEMKLSVSSFPLGWSRLSWRGFLLPKATIISCVLRLGQVLILSWKNCSVTLFLWAPHSCVILCMCICTSGGTLSSVVVTCLVFPLVNRGKKKQIVAAVSRQHN